jgi:hypothetical protein
MGAMGHKFVYIHKKGSNVKYCSFGKSTNFLYLVPNLNFFFLWVLIVEIVNTCTNLNFLRVHVATIIHNNSVAFKVSIFNCRNALLSFLFFPFILVTFKEYHGKIEKNIMHPLLHEVRPLGEGISRIEATLNFVSHEPLILVTPFT